MRAGSSTHRIVVAGLIVVQLLLIYTRALGNYNATSSPDASKSMKEIWTNYFRKESGNDLLYISRWGPVHQSILFKFQNSKQRLLVPHMDMAHARFDLNLTKQECISECWTRPECLGILTATNRQSEKSRAWCKSDGFLPNEVFASNTTRRFHSGLVQPTGSSVLHSVRTSTNSLFPV